MSQYTIYNQQTFLYNGANRNEPNINWLSETLVVHGASPVPTRDYCFKSKLEFNNFRYVTNRSHSLIALN